MSTPVSIEDRKKSIEEKKKKLEKLKQERQEFDSKQVDSAAAESGADLDEVKKYKAAEKIYTDLQAEEMGHRGKVKFLREQLAVLMEQVHKLNSEISISENQASDLLTKIIKAKDEMEYRKRKAFPPAPSAAGSPRSSVQSSGDPGWVEIKPTKEALESHRAMVDRIKVDGKLVAWSIFMVDENKGDLLLDCNEMIPWNLRGNLNEQALEWKEKTFVKLIDNIVSRRNPCLATVDMKYITKDGRFSEKTAFIKWLPSGTPLRVSKVYGTLVSTLKQRQYFNIQKIVEAADKGDLAMDEILDRC